MIGNSKTLNGQEIDSVRTKTRKNRQSTCAAVKNNQNKRSVDSLLLKKHNKDKESSLLNSKEKEWKVIFIIIKIIHTVNRIILVRQESSNICGYWPLIIDLT